VVAVVEGITPLMQHRITDAAKLGIREGTRKVKRVVKLPREEAEEHLYRLEDGTLYHPGEAILAGLREAASYHKQKSTRKSCKYVLPAACMITSAVCPLLVPGSLEPLTEWEVDVRTGVNGKTKDRIVVCRPRFDRWALRVEMELFTDVLDEAEIRGFLVECGLRIGIGSFRPERGGPFGRFHLVSWVAGSQAMSGVAK